MDNATLIANITGRLVGRRITEIRGLEEVNINADGSYTFFDGDVFDLQIVLDDGTVLRPETATDEVTIVIEVYPPADSTD